MQQTRLRASALVFLFPFTLALDGAAAATECGDARAQAAQWRAIAQVEDNLAATDGANRGKHQAALRDAQGQLKRAEARAASACATHRATIAALPLGYVVTPPGAGSKAWVEPGDRWGLTLTTLAGAKNGIVFNDAAVVTVPAGGRWEWDGKPDELAVVAALDAQLVVDEPSPGVGAWRIDLTGAPVILPASELRKCAESGAPVSGAKLPATTCAMLLRVDPFGGPSAVPERGRAVAIGEWQYGDRAGFELGDELSDVAAGGPPPRLDLALDLSAPIPGVTEGKKLVVTVGLNRKTNLAGSAVKLSQECGGDDTACQAQWLAVDLWFDRVFAVPFVRRRALDKGAQQLSGTVADRLGKPLAGQRVMLQSGEHRILTITDADGKYHLDAPPAGEVTVAAVGRKLGAKPRADYLHAFMVGATVGPGPKLLIDRVFE